jgi:hypothetical protein
MHSSSSGIISAAMSPASSSSNEQMHSYRLKQFSVPPATLLLLALCKNMIKRQFHASHAVRLSGIVVRDNTSTFVHPGPSLKPEGYVMDVPGQ